MFVYFDNDVKVRAPYDARSLAHRLGLGPQPAEPPEIKGDARPLLAAARQCWPGYRRRTLRAVRSRAPAPRRKATRAK